MTTENDTGRSRTFKVTVTYKGTTILIEVKQGSDFDPYNDIVTIGGVVWMKYNLGKSKQEGVTFATKLPSECVDDPIKTKSHGRFYQWDVGNKSWESIGTNVSGWNNTNPPTKNTSWLESNDPCPDDYRLPTKEEFMVLQSSTTQTSGGGWSINDYGYKIFTAGDVKLEFPAVGNRGVALGTLYSDGRLGNYWSSQQSNETKAYYLRFGESPITIYEEAKAVGFSIRCVKK